MPKKSEPKKVSAKGAVELNEDKLDAASGGLLLPAVQKVREAAARMKC